jgi:hypothetical protein
VKAGKIVPAVGTKEKSKTDNDDRKGKKIKVDWASVDRPFRGTGNYLELALVFYFLTDKRAYINDLVRSTCKLPFHTFQNDTSVANSGSHNSHYAPTHLDLLANEKAQIKEYERKVTRYNPEKDRAKLAEWKDQVLEEERAWIVEQEHEERQAKRVANT